MERRYLRNGRKALIRKVTKGYDVLLFLFEHNIKATYPVATTKTLMHAKIIADNFLNDKG